MGDVDTFQGEPKTKNSSCDEPKTSVDVMRPIEGSEEIPNQDKNVDNVQNENKEKSSIKIETVFENTESSDSSTEKMTKSENVEAKSEIVMKPNEKIAFSSKNRSDIFSLNDTSQLTTAIFSVTGAPSRRPQPIATTDTTEASRSNETVTTQMSTSSRNSQYRNPLTGIGVNSTDEFRSKPKETNDRNPLLGVGYNPEHRTSKFSTKRIPPGGYSQGLW